MSRWITLVAAAVAVLAFAACSQEPDDVNAGRDGP